MEVDRESAAPSPSDGAIGDLADAVGAAPEPVVSARPSSGTVRRGIVQAKLTVGPVGDQHEREADRVADHVVRRLNQGSGSDVDGSTDRVQRNARVQRSEPARAPSARVRRSADDVPGVGADGGPLDPSTDRSIKAARGRGRPLDEGVRSSMGQAFGADFSGVRVHTGGEADRLNRRVQAKAFTTGSDVFFRQGEYDPASSSGQHLLAHELTHVVQQGGAPQADDGSVQRTTSDPPTVTADSPKVRRAVGFEFEDPTWTVFKLQNGRSFRDPASVHWYNPKSWSKGHLAPSEDVSPHDEDGAEYEGRDIMWEAAGDDPHINNKVTAFNLATGPKKGTLHDGPGYDIEPDGPYDEVGVTGRMDLEVVTDPFPETPEGREALEAALEDLRTVFGRIDARASGAWDGSDLTAASFVTPQQHGFSDQGIYLVGGKSGGAFKPQVTAGVPLEDLVAMMETLGVATDESATQSDEASDIRTAVYGGDDPVRLSQDATINTMGNAPGHARRVVDQLRRDDVLPDDDLGFDALEGFLAAAIVYMVVLSPVGNDGLKVSTPLLSRYSFAALWNQVPGEHRAGLEGSTGELIAAVDAELQPALRNFLMKKYPNTWNGVMERRVTDGLNGSMLSVRVKETVEERGAPVTRNADSFNSAMTSFTRADWLRNLLVGRDLLTPGDLLGWLGEQGGVQAQAAEEYGKSMAIYLRGHGNTSNVRDDVGGEDQGGLALFENRNANPWKGTKDSAGISLDQAVQFALTYFDYLVALRTRERAVTL